MSTQDRNVTRYREHSILINPSGLPENAQKDAFSIFEPGANPMNTLWLYDLPKDDVNNYLSEDEAYEAALRRAKSWIDDRLK